MKATAHTRKPSPQSHLQAPALPLQARLALSAPLLAPGLGTTWSMTTIQVTQRFWTGALIAWLLQLAASTAVRRQGKDMRLAVELHRKAAIRTFTVKLSAFSTGGSPGR